MDSLLAQLGGGASVRGREGRVKERLSKDRRAASMARSGVEGRSDSDGDGDYDSDCGGSIVERNPFR
jgi:hypothetical protein